MAILRVFFFLIGGAMLALGLWQTVIGAGDLIEASRSAQWPSVQGQVLGATVYYSNTGARHGSGRSYTPVISYSYAVNGETLTGATIAPGRLWGSASAYAAVRNFARGTTPLVYYSPDDPHMAVLVPGLSAANFGYLAVGLLFATFGVIGLLAGWSASPRSKNPGPVNIRKLRWSGKVTLFFCFLMVAELVAAIWSAQL